MYAGLANPIDVSVPGVSPNNIKIRINNGTLTNDRERGSGGRTFKGMYAVRPSSAGQNVQIIVTATINGRPITYAPYEFRVKAIPQARAEFAKRNAGSIPRASAAAQTGVYAVLPDFDFDIQYKVTGFTLLYTDKGSDYEEPSNSSNLTQRQKDLIGRLTRGKNLIIKDIKAVGPDGRTQDLSPIILKID
jgi:hypothetical protein